MLRIHFMQLWFKQSDPRMEALIDESESVRLFAGIELGSEAVPDESTIFRFLHLLEQYRLAEQRFDRVGRDLEQRGLLVRCITIVDATRMAVPPLTKNQTQARDPDMSQTRKGSQWSFGMKIHIGTDPSASSIPRWPRPPRSMTRKCWRTACTVRSGQSLGTTSMPSRSAVAATPDAGCAGRWRRKRNVANLCRIKIGCSTAGTMRCALTLSMCPLW